MNRLLGVAALFGFILALAVHISALIGIDVSEHIPGVWALHLGIFIVFVPLVFSSRKLLGLRPSFTEIRAAFPLWVVVAGCCIFVYAALNFLLFIWATQGGNPSLVDGKYVLLNHAKLIRELTLAEYTSYKANELRGFSGHWLVFYYVPFAYFTFYKKPNHSLQRPAYGDR